MKPLENESNLPPVETCAAQVMDTVPLIMRVIRAEMRSHRAPDLSIPQFRALLRISRRPGVSLSDVAEHLGLSLPTTSKLIDRLVGRGLVTRQSAADDRRRVTLALTEAGQATLREAVRFTQARLVQDLAALPPEDCAIIVQAMGLLRQVFITEAETQKTP